MLARVIAGPSSRLVFRSAQLKRRPAYASLRLGAAGFPVLAPSRNLHTARPVFQSLPDAPTENPIKEEGADVISQLLFEKTKARISVLSSVTSLFYPALVVCGAGAGAISNPVSGMFLLASSVMWASMGAGAFNQIDEAKQDALMERTKNRVMARGLLPLPTAQVAAGCVTALGVGGVASAAFLLGGSPLLAAGITAGNAFLYSKIYTPLKTMHWSNTLVGAAVGAITPLIGLYAMPGNVMNLDLLLPTASFFFFAQLPHFCGIAVRDREDYARAGFKMVGNPETDAELSTATKVIMLGSLGAAASSAALAVILFKTMPIAAVAAGVGGIASLVSMAQFATAAGKKSKEAIRQAGSDLFDFATGIMALLPLVLVVCAAVYGSENALKNVFAEGAVGSSVTKSEETTEKPAH